MSRTERFSRSASRRELIKAGLFGAMGIASVAVVPEVMAMPKKNDVMNDIKVLNNALFYEHQAIWAYGFAAGKLTTGNVGVWQRFVSEKDTSPEILFRQWFQTQILIISN